jgi:hypothetical protein
MSGTQPSVEERLEQLLRVKEFASPPDFARRAQVRDAAVYQEADTDGPGLVGGPGPWRCQPKLAPM